MLWVWKLIRYLHFLLQKMDELSESNQKDRKKIYCFRIIDQFKVSSKILEIKDHFWGGHL